MPEEFASQWLTLREPADHTARAMQCLHALTAYLGPDQALNILDLGSGTGSNVRYLAPQLTAREQHWTLLDHDSGLLACAREKIADFLLTSASDRRIQITEWQSDLYALFAKPFRTDLITASALLDLVSSDWIDQFVGYCSKHRLPVLFALTFDGEISLRPTHPDDAWIEQLINAHQRGAKDMGQALGPDATRYTVDAFAKAGFEVMERASDWNLGPDQMALQQATLNGWYDAAIDQAPTQIERINHWFAQRQSQHTQTHFRVGHRDILALPCRA